MCGICGVISSNELRSSLVYVEGLSANYHLLGCRDDIPRLMAALDGNKTESEFQIPWCEVVLCEQETNLGLGRSILTGSKMVFQPQ